MAPFSSEASSSAPSSWTPAAEGTPEALANLLASLARSSALRRGLQFSYFESKSAPGISVEDYLKRLMIYFKCSHSCLVLAAVYMNRILALCPDLALSDLNIHRLILASLTVAAKVHDDKFYPNSWYAKIGGVSNGELNALEAEFLRLVQWRVYVSTDDYESCLQQLRLSGDPAQGEMPLGSSALPQPEPAKAWRARPPSRQPFRPGSAAGRCSGASSSGLRLVRRIWRYREPSGSRRCAAQAALRS